MVFARGFVGLRCYGAVCVIILHVISL